jgi:hypothetical protein
MQQTEPLPSGAHLVERELKQRSPQSRLCQVTDSLLTTVAEPRAGCRREDHPLADKIHSNDLWIAASAIHIGATLISADTMFRGVPDLPVSAKVRLAGHRPLILRLGGIRSGRACERAEFAEILGPIRKPDETLRRAPLNPDIELAAVVGSLSNHANVIAAQAYAG